MARLPADRPAPATDPSSCAAPTRTPRSTRCASGSWPTARRASRCSEQAVLVRAAHHSDLLELELSRRRIPYVKYGGLRFLEAAHVKDLICLFRLADNPRDELAWFRLLQLLEGVGPVTRPPGDRPRSGSTSRAPTAEVLLRWPLAVEELPGRRPRARPTRSSSALRRAARRGGRRRTPSGSATRSRRWSSAAYDERRRPAAPTSTRWWPRPHGAARLSDVAADLTLEPPQLHRRPRRPAVDRRGLARHLHRALGQGARVGRRPPPQRRRRQLPLRHGAHHQRGARGGAPALLRRGHPTPPGAARLRPVAVPLPAPRPRRRTTSSRSRRGSCRRRSPPASRSTPPATSRRSSTSRCSPARSSRCSSSRCGIEGGGAALAGDWVRQCRSSRGARHDPGFHCSRSGRHRRPGADAHARARLRAQHRRPAELPARSGATRTSGWPTPSQKLTELAAAGVRTIVDPTVIGLGRYIPRIQRIAEQVPDLNIVVATGCYTYDDVPFFFHYRGPALERGRRRRRCPTRWSTCSSATSTRASPAPA